MSPPPKSLSTESLRLVVNLLHSPADLTGTGRYALEMLRSLAALPEKPEIIGIVGPWNREAFRLNPMPANYRLVTWGRPWSSMPLRRIEEWLWLEGVARDVKPDVFWGPTNFLPLFLLGKSFPCVATIHDMTFFRHPDLIGRVRGTYWRWWTRRTIKVADLIVTVSQTAAKEISEYSGIPEGRAQVVTNGVDERFFRDASNQISLRQSFPNLPANYALFVGTLTPHKNLPRLIRALKLIRAMPGSEDAKLVLAGKKGEGYAEVARAIEQENLSDAVLALGFVPDKLLPPLYGAARLAAMPSLNEGFGLPIIEAMAAGAPVVTSRKGAMAEVAANAACLADVEDEADLAEKLHTVWTNASLREGLIEAGLKRAREFSWDASARRFYSILEEVARRRP